MATIEKAKQEMPPEVVKTILSLVFFWPLGVYMTLKHRPYWFRKTSFIVILVIYAYVISWIAVAVMMSPSEQSAGERQWLKTISLEEGRNYQITAAGLEGVEQKDISGVMNIDCDLQEVRASSSSDKYSGQSNTYKCTDGALKGSYSHYASTALIASGFGNDFKTNENRYTLDLRLTGFTKLDWEKDSLDLSSLQKNGITKIVELSIKNKILDSAVVAEKVVTIRFNFTDSDITILKTQNDTYNAYVKAENERKANEAAEKKAKDDAKKLEAERQKQVEQDKANTPPVQSSPRPQPQQPTAPTPPTPPVESNNLPLKAICSDGSVSYQDTPSLPNYRGMCSGHGGIKTKLGRVP